VTAAAAARLVVLKVVKSPADIHFGALPNARKSERMGSDFSG
jgi:hypothetical protein